MLNVMWPVFIIASVIYAFITGNMNDINVSIFDSLKGVVELCITFLGTICFWNGIMKIAQETGLAKKISEFIEPILNIIFPELKENQIIKNDISLNIVANILGLGNAATPLGIKAMKSMQKINANKKVISNSMALFIVINTASLQLIPTTVIGIRSSLNSNYPTKIIIPVWIATFFAMFAGVISSKIFIKMGK